MTSTDQDSRIEWIRQMFAAGDANDVEGLLEYLTDDVVLVFGNGEPVTSKVRYGEMTREFRATVRSVRHELVGIWPAANDDDVIVAQAVVTYMRLDGTSLGLPCCNVFRLRDGLIAEYRIFMDPSPLAG
jgi:ketosteroid isomerase-like protein